MLEQIIATVVVDWTPIHSALNVVLLLRFLCRRCGRIFLCCWITGFIYRVDADIAANTTGDTRFSNVYGQRRWHSICGTAVARSRTSVRICYSDMYCFARR